MNYVGEDIRAESARLRERACVKAQKALENPQQAEGLPAQ